MRKEHKPFLGTLSNILPKIKRSKSLKAVYKYAWEDSRRIDVKNPFAELKKRKVETII